MFIFIPEKNTSVSKKFNAQVMTRVRFICYFRKILNPIFLEVGGLGVLIISSIHFISIKTVVANSPTIIDITNSIHFWSAAFIETELPIKAMLVGGTAILGLLVFQAVKSLIYDKTTDKLKDGQIVISY